MFWDSSLPSILFFNWKQLSNKGKALTNTGTAFLVGKTGKHKATSQKYHMR